MKSFEIDSPETYHSSTKLDVFPVHLIGSTEFHLSYDGEPLVVLRKTEGGWKFKSGKSLTVQELAFISQQIG
jgi:hypothetical protein